MLPFTVVLFLVALLAGALGFSDLAAMVANVANVLLFTFVVVFVTRELLERTRGEQVPLARDAVRPDASAVRER